MYWSAFTRRFAIDPRLEFPPVEVWSNDAGAILRAQLPGAQPEELEVEVEKDRVTLAGPRSGREPGRFVREIRLPFAADSAGVRAQFHRGVLEVELPRAEAEKPRKITVKSA